MGAGVAVGAGVGLGVGERRSRRRTGRSPFRTAGLRAMRTFPAMAVDVVTREL